MQAKIVFRGNKCFREFDLKTVAEKLGLSIDDFNHFALAVDEKNGKTILYHQTGISESIGLSIGNEDESFTQIEINGFKGYAETEGETPFIIWSDGISLYTISSNISFDELFVIAESIQ